MALNILQCLIVSNRRLSQQIVTVECISCSNILLVEAVMIKKFKPTLIGFIEQVLTFIYLVTIFKSKILTNNHLLSKIIFI